LYHDGQLEVAGLGEGGCLRWIILTLHPDYPRHCQTNLSTHEGYLAGTIVRPGFLAGVRKTKIEWLRCGGSSCPFFLVATTPIALPQAVACFPSHATNELIVVCAEGFVVRVPVPT
jgi:hypothetical protein